MGEDQFHTEIGLALRDLVPSVPEELPRPGLAERVEGKARSRRRRRAVTAAAVLAVAAACVIGLLVATPFRPADDVAVTVAEAPPQEDADGPYVLVRPDVVPPAGGQLVLTVAVPGDVGVTYGLAGKVDRWDGAAWRPYSHFVGAQAESKGSGSVVAPGAGYGARSIGFVAGPSGYGTPLWVATGRLSAGYYRFTLGSASGQLEVRNGAAPALPQGAVDLAVGHVPAARKAGWVDVLIETDAGASPAGQLPPPGVNRDGSFSLRGVPGIVELNRLDAGRTVRVTQLRATTASESPIPISAVGFAVHLPALAPGMYELSMRDDVAGEVRGRFTVAP